jgi:hypothetical protein
MSFQWVFDTAESISINKRAVVGQTITRNQTVRATSRGPGIYKFTVRLPDGLPWDQVATYIQALDAADRFTTESVKINNAGYTSWINKGDLSDPNQTWTVICVEFPEWTIFSRNQVSWSGAFVFFEVVT